MTRTAFDATLQITNNEAVSLTNLTVILFVTPANSLLNVTDLFFINDPQLNGIQAAAVNSTNGMLLGGSLGPSSSGSADWSILPTREAAISSATIYSVGGTLSYEQNGVFVSVQLSPATITVYPEALLDLQYFLQRDVYGDDPFTPQIEPSIPFTLAVMVTNIGNGSANNFQITSSQPTIVDNQKGKNIK